MRNLLIATIFILFAWSIKSQEAHKNLRNGDMLYGFGKFAESETEYRKAESSQSSLKSSYNMGNTLMNQERFEEAIKKYQDAATKATSDMEKAIVNHNLGNALYKKQQFKESIESYKKALRYQPYDTETKENLALARRELKKQEQQQQKDKQNNEQNKDKENQKENQNRQDQKQEEDQNNQNNQEDNQQENKNQPSDQNDKKMGRQDAQKLLQIMDNEEKKVQQKLRRVDGKSSKPKKDW